ncbi:Protein MRG1 [Camellia lanceoleosa]|uniref:Protein MRG1 n=1 Tax=Camellia lanceoleosa TaxID=1840588 RepID=A0ACC0HNC1_9ERIC|nr:Protein MRG1 [Camellia lanceoleosa]
MGSSNAGVTDDSATISDGSTTETDIDIRDSVDSLPSPDSSPFSEGEKVLAYHKLKIYEAKVQKVEFRMKEWRYCSLSSLAFVVLQLCHFDEINTSNNYNVFAKTILARGKKRKNDSVTKEKGSVPPEKLVNIHIPSTLKKQLVDDCDPNVDEILSKYLAYRLKKDDTIADSVQEILNGLRCYFNKAMPVMLLYQSERQQYQEVIADDVSPSNVYGAEHLLRLFVKLPEMLYYANIEEETLKELQQKLLDFLKFMQKNQSAFFLSAYQTPEGFDASSKKQGSCKLVYLVNCYEGEMYLTIHRNRMIGVLVAKLYPRTRDDDFGQP